MSDVLNEACRSKYGYEVSTIGNLEDEVVVKAVTLKKLTRGSTFSIADLEIIITAEFPDVPRDKLMCDILDGALMILYIKEKAVVPSEN